MNSGAHQHAGVSPAQCTEPAAIEWCLSQHACVVARYCLTLVLINPTILLRPLSSSCPHTCPAQQQVALQFPEGLLMYACTIADILQEFAGVCVVWCVEDGFWGVAVECVVGGI